MKKRLFSVFISILLILTLFPPVALAGSDFPGTLDAPKNIAVSTEPNDDGTIYSFDLGFSFPSSIAAIPDKWESWHAANNASEMYVALECDYKYNASGSWHYAPAWDQPDGAPLSYKQTDFGTNGIAYIKPDLLTDVPNQAGLLNSNTLYFRSRFVVAYYDNNAGNYVKTVSPWSETAAIGKDANAVAVKVEPPVLTKAELKKDGDTGAPYFEITTQIPDSIKTLDNTDGAINIGVEYRINGGEWKVRPSYDKLQEVIILRPEYSDPGNNTNIEAASYEVRARYGYGPTYGIVDTWSDYSNILTIGTPKFESTRLSGQTRIETAIAISKEGWPNGADAVILTRDDNYPDALTGTPLAKKLDAPILFTNTYNLTPATDTEIKRLNPKKIVILGGTGAVSQAIEDYLKFVYPTVQRIGGADRYETAAKISAELGFKGKVVIATGEDFHDALVAAPLAAYQGIPMLLGEKDGLPSSTTGALNAIAPTETIVVGKSDAVSDSVLASLPNARRYSGSDYYQTAVVAAKGFGADPSMIFFATGKDFPDALCGSALAAKHNSPILFVNDPISDSVRQYLTENKSLTKDIRMLGGEGVIPESTRNAITQILEN